jgi:reactive chlorine resistance protein C
MEKLFSAVTPGRAEAFARYSLALMFGWFGAMSTTVVGQAILERWLSGHVLFAGQAATARPLALAIGAVEIMLALGLASGRKPLVRLAAQGAMAFTALALTLLVLANAWVEPMGGFPVIGAGQGILKYVAIFGVALYLFDPAGKKDLALGIVAAGLILVLGWIGGMKFTAIEAEGIKDLLATSPFFAWMIPVFGVQGASNAIGMVEVATALLLVCWWVNGPLFTIGAGLAAITFLATLSFLVSLPGWEDALGGFPALSRSGYFLLKDLVLLAGVLLLLANSRPARVDG